MKKISIFCLLLLALCSCEREPRLIILHVNDTHSHFEPFQTADGLKGGCIERAAFVDSVRLAEGEDRVLLLHAGDFSQGTSYFSELKGELEPEIINAMGYDVIEVGNHEFDNGIEALEARLRKVTGAQFVCSNIDLSAFGLGELVKPYVVLEKNGVKVGVIGLDADLSSMVTKSVSMRMQMLDNVEVTNKWSDFLRNQEHCELVILLSHIGYHEDQELVPLTHGIDIVIGGHSHTFVDHMINVKDADGKTVPIVTDGCWGQEIGKITVR